MRVYSRVWFALAREIVLFLLGVGLMIYAAVTPGHDIPFIVTGLVLVGLVPIDEWFSRLPTKPPEQ
jgi:hypothetical protein